MLKSFLGAFDQQTAFFCSTFAANFKLTTNH